MVRFLTILSLLCLLSCRSPRPELPRWESCLLEGHDLAREDVAGETTLSPLARQDRWVLYLHAEWGRSPFVTEYTFGYLMLSLPGGLKAGDTVELAEAGQGQYREGGQALIFDSIDIRGKVKVLAIWEDRVELDLNLEARSPSVDWTKVGRVPLCTKVRALRVRSLKECF